MTKTNYPETVPVQNPSNKRSVVRVIIVEPKHPENIGTIARACHIFNIRELYFVNPQCNVLHTDAYRTAVNGGETLRNGIVVGSIESALNDCDLILGTSDHSIGGKREIDLKNIKNESIVPFNRLGLLFGREDSGLKKDETNWCQSIITIQTASSDNVFNIAQAVLLVLWEMSSSLISDLDIAANHLLPSVAEKKDLVSRYGKILKNLKRSETVISKKSSRLIDVLSASNDNQTINLIYDLLGLLENPLKQ